MEDFEIRKKYIRLGDFVAKDEAFDNIIKIIGFEDNPNLMRKKLGSYLLKAGIPIYVDIDEEIKSLYTECIGYTPRDYDFSQGYIDEWEISLDLTEEEEQDEYFAPMMNYIYGLPDDFETDMVKKFGSDWRTKIKPLLSNTTLIYFNKEHKYYIALTGGGMDLSWEICETYINLGYLPPMHFCGLPKMGGMDIFSRKYYRIVKGCMRSAEVTGYRATRISESLVDYLN